MPYDLTQPEVPLSIIFELDDNSFHGHARFARFLDEKRALGLVRDEVEQGWGHWEGESNPCYVMSQRDFDAVASTIILFIQRQQAVMHVGVNGAAYIRDRLGNLLDAGVVKKVPASELGNYKGYTLLKRGAFVMV